jgi:hypothetical protein
MCIPLLAITFIAAITPLTDFDGRAFWALKAKALGHERSIDAPFFHGASLDPRNRYPLLVPLDGAVLLTAAHSLDDRHLRWLYLAFFAALTLMVRERLGELVSPAAGAWCAALLVWIPQFLAEPEGGALSAYNDIAIAAFAAGAFFELLAADSTFRFAMWLAFLVLTKSEGLPFALVFLGAGPFVFGRRIKGPALATTLAAAALFFWRFHVPAGDEEDVLALLPTLPEKLHRIGNALAGFPRHMIGFSHWGVFWIAVIVAAVFALRVDKRGALLAIGVMAAMLTVYIGVYIVTAWVQAELIAVTADRLLMHIIGPALALLALASQRWARAKSM